MMEIKYVVAFINTEVATSPTTFQYFINNGGGVFANGFIIGESGPNGQEVHAVDFDNDGDTDVLYAEGSDDEVGWIENLGSGTWGTRVVLTTQANGAQSLTVADFDADGDQDVMIGGEYDDEWVWHQNNGNQTLAPQILMELATMLRVLPTVILMVMASLMASLFML